MFESQYDDHDEGHYADEGGEGLPSGGQFDADAVYNRHDTCTKNREYLVRLLGQIFVLHLGKTPSEAVMMAAI